MLILPSSSTYRALIAPVMADYESVNSDVESVIILKEIRPVPTPSSSNTVSAKKVSNLLTTESYATLFYFFDGTLRLQNKSSWTPK